tara:strand:+ start:56 stop:1051 length:996 start_codon:yes stop_codon:yes gene_type:complete
MGLFDNLTNAVVGGASVAGIYDAYDRLKNVGSTAQQASEGIATQARDMAAFKPFGVSTGFGGLQTDASGGYSTTLSPQQQGLQKNFSDITQGLIGSYGNMGSQMPQGYGSSAFAGSQQALNAAQQDPAARESEIYNRLIELQAPSQERDRIALENRLLGQGRLGLQTSAYGGSKEQFSMDQAQEESRRMAALSAMEQARAEQTQNLGQAQGMFELGNLASSFPAAQQSANLGNISTSLGLQYMPEQQLLNTLNPAVNVASIADLGRREGAGLFDETSMSGIEALLQAEMGGANTLGQVYASMLSGAMAPNATKDPLGDFVGSIFNKINPFN